MRKRFGMTICLGLCLLCIVLFPAFVHAGELSADSGKQEPEDRVDASGSRILNMGALVLGGGKSED